LRRLARNQERMEALERLHITPPGGSGQPLRRQPRDNPVDVLPRDLPGRTTASSQEPLQGASRIADSHLAETTSHLRNLKRPQALLLKGNRIRPRARLHRSAAHPSRQDPQSDSSHATFLPPEK